jgi:hypothetical protein
MSGRNAPSTDRHPSATNPYAAPAAHPSEAAGRAFRKHRVPSPALYAFCALEALALFLDLAAMTGSVPRTLSGYVRLVGLLIYLVWLQQQWGRLPARLQVVSGHGVTPVQAAWRNLIPFYGLYWIFVVNAALTEGINAMLAKKGKARSAPMLLSILCPIALVATRTLRVISKGPQLIAGLLVMAGLFMAYMIRVEFALALAKRKR